MKKRRLKIVVNNKLRGDYGAMSPKTNKIEVNVKAHKGDKAELASTVAHEIMHVKHPKMTEKEVYKKTAKTKIPIQEQHKLIAKLRHKNMRYKQGALKRKFKMKRGASMKPGDFINQMNAQKAKRIPADSGSISKERLAIMGLV